MRILQLLGTLMLLLLVGSGTASASVLSNDFDPSGETGAITNQASAPLTFTGSNSQVTPSFSCTAGLLLISWTVSDGLFTIELVDDQGKVIDYVTSQYNEGPGSTVLNVPRAGTYMLKVTASSSWTATLSTTLYSTQATSFSGSNDLATPAISCNAGRLDVAWTVDDGLFSIQLVDDQGKVVQYIASQYDQGPGSTVTNVPKTGNYLLKVTASSPWTVALSSDTQAAAPSPPATTESTFSGSNSQVTSPFSCTTGLLLVSWTVNDGLFTIELVDNQGKAVDYVTSQYNEGPGSTVVNVPRAGTYMLKVTASSPWTATLSTTLYSTQATSFSGSNDLATPAISCNAGRLDVAWTVDDGLFSIQLVDDQGKVVQYIASQYDQGPGSTVTNVPKAGNYLLKVTASSPWTIALSGAVKAPVSAPPSNPPQAPVPTTLPTLVQTMPAPIATVLPVVTTLQPVAGPTLNPSSSWGKRYAVGDPGSFLGTRFSTGTAPTGTSGRRAVTTTDTVLKPGSRSYGITPPASGSFVRWYPAARWQAGIK